MKILRPSNNYVAGIFFPIGSPEEGGTCQHASKECVDNCYAKKKDYDERVNIPEFKKRGILNFFINKPTTSICTEIIKEMEELQAIILSWFASGDCLDEHVNKLFEIMILLQEKGIIQNGFTRNNNLYGKILRSEEVNYDVLRIVFTIESEDIIYRPVCGIGNYPRGIYGVPDYKRGVVALYYATPGYKSYGGCGFGDITHKFDGKEIEIATNCLGCFKKKIGCFINLGQRSRE